MKTNFKVGDKVWDGYRFPEIEGVVSSINKDALYQLDISFAGNFASYTMDGRYVMDNPPTLSKVPYTFQLPEQPHEFEEGDPVLVRDDSTDVWIGSRYKCESHEADHPHEVLIGTTTVSWSQCIPFDIDKLGRV